MATGDPNEALRAFVGSRRKPAPQSTPDPNAALAAFVSSRKQQASGSASLAGPSPMQRLQQGVTQRAQEQERNLGLARYAAPLVNPLAAPFTVWTSPTVQAGLNAGSQAMAPMARQAFSSERPEDLAGNLGPATRAGLQAQGRTATQHLESIQPSGTNDVLDNPILRKSLMGTAIPGLGLLASDIVSPQDIRDSLKAGVEAINGAPLGDGTDNFGPLTRRGLDRRAQTMQQRVIEKAQAEQAAASGGIEGWAARGIQGSPVAPETVYDVATRAGMSPEIAMATEAVMDPQNIIEALPIARIAGIGNEAARALSVGDDLGAAFARGMDEAGSELGRGINHYTDPNAALRKYLATKGTDAPAPPPVPVIKDRNLDRAIQTLRQNASEPLPEISRAPFVPPTEEEALRSVRALPDLRDIEQVATDTALSTVRRLPPVVDPAVAEEAAIRAVRSLPDVAALPEITDVATEAALRAVRELAPVRSAEDVAVDAVRRLPAITTEEEALRAVRDLKPVPPRDQFMPSRPPGREPGKVPSRAMVSAEESMPPARGSMPPEAVPPVPDTRIPGKYAQELAKENGPHSDPNRALQEFISNRGPRTEAPARQADPNAALQEFIKTRQPQRRIQLSKAVEGGAGRTLSEAALPGPTSLEQGYAPQGALRMGTPQPGAPAGGRPQVPTVPMPTQPAPQPPRRQSIGQMLTTLFTGKRPPGQVKSKPELIREMAATLDKMDGVKSVYGMGASADRRTPARFLSKIKLIEIKRGNLDGFVHEVGHAFDERQAGNFSRRAELADELDTLGAQGHSSWRPGMDDLRRRQEGVAEFVRMKFENPQGVAQRYPKMNAAFESHLDELGDLGAEWRQHQQNLQLRLKSDGAAKAAAQITSKPDQKWKMGDIHQTVAGAVDRYDPLRAVDETVAAARGTTVEAMTPQSRLYTQARLLKNLSKKKVQEFQTALKEVLAPINEMGAEASSNFVQFITARHAVEMEKAGLATGEDLANWEALVQALDSPEFQKAADDLYAWQKSVNDYAIAEGNLDPMRVEEWYGRWKHYVPTNREMENVIGQVNPKGFSGGGAKGLKASRGPNSWTHKKKGGQQRILDPLETMLENMVKTVDSTERNRIGKLLAEAWDEQDPLVRDGEKAIGSFVRELKPSELANKQYVTVRDGRPDAGTFRERYFEFTDPDLYQAFTAMDEKQVGWFVRMLSKPANLLRWGATKVSLPFVVNNLQRDTVGAALNSRVGSLPVLQSLDGLFTVIRSHLGDAGAKEVVEAFANSGGKQGLEEMFSAGPANAKKIYRDVFSSMSPVEQALTVLPPELRGAVRTTGKAAKTAVTSPFKILEALSDLSEQATRVGEFKGARKALAKQNPNWSKEAVDQQAGFEAMDLLDFDLRGNSELIRAVRQIVPFSGSSITGLYRNAQAFGDNPAKFGAKALGFLAAPTMTLYALNQNNPYYWELSQQDRDNHWHVPIPEPLAKAMGINNPAERFWRFKKPFLMGTLGGAAPERFFQWWQQKDPKAFDGFLSTVVSQSTPATVDDLGGPINKLVWEIGSNWDSFRQRDIEPEWERKGPGEIPSYLRSNEYSSITSRLLSKAMSKLPIPAASKFSPVQLDHILRGTTGGGGEAIVKGRLFGNVPGLNRIGIDPILKATGLAGNLEEAKASSQQFLGQVPTENRHESENRFFARLGELRETVNDPNNPQSKKMGKTLERYENAEKELKGWYKKRAAAKDEAQRMRINRKIVQITERLEPPTGRQKELRKQR